MKEYFAFLFFYDCDGEQVDEYFVTSDDASLIERHFEDIINRVHDLYDHDVYDHYVKFIYHGYEFVVL